MKGVCAPEPRVGMWWDSNPFPFSLQGSLSPACAISGRMLCEKLYLLGHCPCIFYLESCLFVSVVMVSPRPMSSQCASAQQPIEMSLVQENLTTPVVLRAGKGTGGIEEERLAKFIFSSAWHHFPSILSHTFKKLQKKAMLLWGRQEFGNLERTRFKSWLLYL